MAGKGTTIFMGGKGSVVMPRIHSKGLRNKRKAYWAGLRMAEQKEKERREKARERAEQFDYSPQYDY